MLDCAFAGAMALAMLLVSGAARAQDVPVESGAAPPSGAAQRGRREEDDVFASRGPLLLPPARAREGGSPSWTRWGLLSFAGASAMTTLGAVIYREVHAQRWNDGARCLTPGLTRAEVCGRERAAARTGERLALVGGSLTAVLTLGVLLHAAVSSDAPAAAAASARFGCGLGGSALGVSCDGSF